MPATRSPIDEITDLMTRILARLSEGEVGEVTSRVRRQVESMNASARIADALRTLREQPRAPRAGRMTRMTRADIDSRLREYERAWEKAHGEQMSSEEFYERYCSGEFDTRFGARWATYYEAVTLAVPARPAAT